MKQKTSKISKKLNAALDRMFTRLSLNMYEFLVNNGVNEVVAENAQEFMDNQLLRAIPDIEEELQTIDNLENELMTYLHDFIDRVEDIAASFRGQRKKFIAGLNPKDEA